MTLRNDDIRASCAAELRTVLDSYIGPNMGPGAATAVMDAMQEATAHLLVSYGWRGPAMASDVATLLGAYVYGIGQQLAAMQRPAIDGRLRR